MMVRSVSTCCATPLILPLIGGRLNRLAAVLTVAELRRHPSATLLAAQLVAVLAYPFLDGSTAGRAVLGVLQLLVVLSGLRAVRSSPAVTWFAVVFGAPAMVFAVWESVAPGTDWVVLTSACLHVPF